MIMNENQEDLTVNEKYIRAVKVFRDLTEGKASSARKDSVHYQDQIKKTINEFKSISTIIDSLHLFSENETLEEMNVKYIPFLNISYYIAVLFQNFMGNWKVKGSEEKVSTTEHKEENLYIAKTYVIKYLSTLEKYGILSKTQEKKLNSWSNRFSPTIEELTAFHGNPTMKRDEKIQNYRLEKQLNEKLKILDSIYSDEESNDADFHNLDEETVRAIYRDHLVSLSLKAFDMLESVLMESQVLSKRPAHLDRVEELEREKHKKSPVDDEFGFTTRLESLPFKQQGISSFLSKEGKILRPFRIDPSRAQMKKDVFGTGQVLPSMTPDEYLQYELANGKMASQDPVQTVEERDTDDSDEEIDKRRWDDWKDDNPKGSGNMKANIG